MWLRKARAGCNLWNSAAQEDVFEGWHDGFMRLPDPVMHRRRIALDKVARRVVIEDNLQMAGEHDIDLFFHCSERCQAEPTENGFTLRQGDRTISLTLPQAVGASVNVYHGSTEPVQGWVSRRFDQKLPAAAIVWHARLASNVVLRTEIAC
jgi:hypothetical protein